MFILNKFTNTLKKEKIVYILIILSIESSRAYLSLSAIKANNLRIRDAVFEPEFLEQLKKYKNIFSIEKVERLLSYKNRDHAIETIIELLFDLLYNLFNIELIALRSYLDDILAKK